MVCCIILFNFSGLRAAIASEEMHKQLCRATGGEIAVRIKAL